MYQVSKKSSFKKDIIYVFFILLLAVGSTYYIYDKFQGDRNIDFNSESLDVTYHEKTGNKITLNKVTPVTDSVGLSSKAYLISVKNNLTEKVDYKIKIVDDDESIEKDKCEDILIPKENLRVSIKVNKKANKIYNLTDLEEGIILEDTIKALEEKDISIRMWVNSDTKIPLNSKLHYHGLIQVIEENNSVAVNK